MWSLMIVATFTNLTGGTITSQLINQEFTSKQLCVAASGAIVRSISYHGTVVVAKCVYTGEK